MSKRADLLVACMLGNRWRASSAPSAGTTAQASSPTPQDANSRVHLESLWYSIVNLTGAAILCTMQAQIRGANATVLASINHLQASSLSANVAVTNIAFANPKKGTLLSVQFNTAPASVTASINLAGWIEDTNG